MKHFYTVFFSFLLSVSFTIGAMAQGILQQGGGPAPSISQKAPCISPEERVAEWDRLQIQRQRLIAEGKLSSPQGRTSQNIQFRIPLKQSINSPYTGYYGITNYVDHDGSSGLEDYICEEVTYDGHRGTDYATWPFPWEMMDNNDVEVVAAAKGVIIEKRDGNFDQSCDWNNKPWNAVYVEHADGSVAWYGHLKKNTLTAKAIGDTVYPGDFLGYIGSSGISTGPHLHFELFDTDGSMLDPYIGTCNPTSSISRWENQDPHKTPSVIHHQTGNRAPDYGNFCYGQEASNEANVFDPGDVIYLSIYMRDYVTSTSSTLKLISPDGFIYDSWSNTPSQFYPLSYWWWSYQTNNSFPQGMWRFDLEYDGKTYSYPFQLGMATSNDLKDELEINIGPNPVRDFVNIEGLENLRLSYEMLDIQGRLLQEGLLENNRIDMTSFAEGLYLLRIRNLENGQSLVTKVVRK
ncbi:MAG: peptidoglycan DD-metalloendopeptidase family protein [Bacteroidia bacterium]|nr:peptidoglycan DD-metalloendopeptidase family protein [Bacteroidia bacterium]